MSYFPHLQLIKGGLDLTIRTGEHMQYRRYLLNAPQAVAKTQRPTYYDGPFLRSLKFVWEVELFIKHTDVRAMVLNQFYISCLADQEANVPNNWITLRDYIDPVTEPIAAPNPDWRRPAAPVSQFNNTHPTWPDFPEPPATALYYTRFAEFKVLIDQPVRNRKGFPTSIEFKLTEL